MFGRKKLEDEITRLTYRVRELEERLCPCEQHLWLITRVNHDVGNAPDDVSTCYTYKCTRCGKVLKTLEKLNVTKDVNV